MSKALISKDKYDHLMKQYDHMKIMRDQHILQSQNLLKKHLARIKNLEDQTKRIKELEKQLKEKDEELQKFKEQTEEETLAKLFKKLMN